MPRVKLAVILPVVFCAVEGLLRYWNIHSVESIPRNGPLWDTAANFISEGLNHPGISVGSLILMPFMDHLPRPVSLLVMFLSVAGVWYLIGNWFDHRGQANDHTRQKGLLPSVVLPALVIICGVCTLGYSFVWVHILHISNFIQTIYIALLQTWAVFLIGIPAVAIVRYFLERRRKKRPSGSTPRPHTRISNFRLFELIVGIFVALLLLWYPYGPLFPK